ncbi:MAG: hypothetical protein KKD44_29270, partial [Proteobacteria bacterium]|nr:hypothetical protein [Pseudomonadota bacterium]
DYLMNVTEQSDRTFNLEIIRESQDNLTDYERVVGYLSSINETCYSLTTDYNFSTQYAEQKSLFDNCTSILTDTQNQRDVYIAHLELAQQSQNSYSANISYWENLFQTCSNEKQVMGTQNYNCQNILTNVTQDYELYKSNSGSGFNNGVFLGFVVTAIVAIIIISRYAQKNRPKTIREYGYGDQ